jgi:hypothetical protein
MAPTRIRVFEERYSGGVLDLNIFCLLILNESDYFTTSLNSGSLSPTIIKPKDTYNMYNYLNIQKHLHSGENHNGVVIDEQTLRPDPTNKENEENGMGNE